MLDTNRWYVAFIVTLLGLHGSECFDDAFKRKACARKAALVIIFKPPNNGAAQVGVRQFIYFQIVGSRSAG